MAGFFRDTTFGELMRLVSRGRLFDYEDNRNEELRERYIQASQEKQWRSSGESGGALEKGQDYVLVDFLEDDPEVRTMSCLMGC